jgi:hypothetical protein
MNEMAIVTLQNTMHKEEMEDNGDTGMYHTNLFIKIRDKTFGDVNDGFVSRGSSSPLGCLGQPY